MKEVMIGDHVVFVNPVGLPFNALVTQVWGKSTDKPAINIVYVSSDNERTDKYGRQTIHETSVVHREKQSAHGMFWRFFNEQEAMAL